MSKMKLKDRIRKHYKREIHYFDLIHACYPEKDYPNAFRRPTQGGPPGCAMAFGKALRDLGAIRGTGDKIWIPADQLDG